MLVVYSDYREQVDITGLKVIMGHISKGEGCVKGCDGIWDGMRVWLDRGEIRPSSGVRVWLRLISRGRGKR